jgi:dTDP-4-amino-4,6-dideoxygalactose transaminase
MAVLQAAYLDLMLTKIADIIGERRRLHSIYARLSLESPGSYRLHTPPEGVTGNGYLSVFSIPGSADKVADLLRAQGISSGRFYPVPICNQPPARNALTFGDLEVSTKFCRSVLNLPLYFGMQDRDCETAFYCLRETETRAA